MNALAWPADHVSDHFPRGLQRSAIVLVQVLDVDPEPELVVHRPQVKNHVSALWSIHDPRAYARSGDDVEEDAAHDWQPRQPGRTAPTGQRPVACHRRRGASGDCETAPRRAAEGRGRARSITSRPSSQGGRPRPGDLRRCLLARATRSDHCDRAGRGSGRADAAAATRRRRAESPGRRQPDHCERHIDQRVQKASPTQGPSPHGLPPPSSKSA